MGSTGFDSRPDWTVSTSGNKAVPVYHCLKHLNGENNYALAA
jgi:hypothetical protein